MTNVEATLFGVLDPQFGLFIKLVNGEQEEYYGSCSVKYAMHTNVVPVKDVFQLTSSFSIDGL